MDKEELFGLVKAAHKKGWPSVIICSEERPSLKMVQDWIGDPKDHRDFGKTTIEQIHMRYRVDGEDAQMYVDEDGRSKGLPDNPLGSLLADQERYGGQTILGRAVILVGPAKFD